jgi:hypothetical protein
VALAEEVATEPLVVHAPLQATQTREWYLELHADPGGERLVTLIELLSPSNKRAGSAGRAEYRRKQAEALAAAVHLVEIDLLRGGAHTTAVPELRLRERVPAFDYHACIRRFDRPDDFLIYPWQLPDRLPILAIPLLPGTPDVPLDLRTLLARVYDTGRYDRRIDYRARAFDPPLTPERVAWLGQVLPAAPQV